MAKVPPIVDVHGLEVVNGGDKFKKKIGISELPIFTIGLTVSVPMRIALAQRRDPRAEGSFRSLSGATSFKRHSEDPERKRC